jgi:death on curing protein
MDGNKRTGFILMMHVLNESHKDLNADENEIYDFVIKIAEGKWNYDEILNWLETRVFEL